MELPEALISHRSAQRIRIKIASERGNADYFGKLQDRLAGLQAFKQLRVNALTGSVLLIDDKLEVEAIASYAKSQHLFRLTTRKRNPSPLAHQAVNPIENVNQLIRQYTSGYADLTSVMFVLLSALGIYDIVRGKPKLPPWYTAFWYAIGIIELKKFFEKSS
ncbi:MAG: hypothetical protein JRH12_20385 [Deltaproteobacteria bacterium]|jgi:hypothetical protein|nr:hypothetical protein [Deltaproteobacteria bacterium]